MDTKHTKEYRNDVFRKLPEAAQDWLGSEELTKIYFQLMKKYDLRIDHSEAFSDETNLFLLGITKPETFVQNLKKRLPQLDQSVINNLAADVNIKLFQPIHDAIIQASQIPEKKPLNEQLQKTYSVKDSPLPKQEEITQTIPKRAPEPSETFIGIPQDAHIPKKVTGIEKTMPKDILQAKVTSSVHTSIEPKEETYAGNDPYREPVE